MAPSRRRVIRERELRALGEKARRDVNGIIGESSSLMAAVILYDWEQGLFYAAGHQVRDLSGFLHDVATDIEAGHGAVLPERPS